jgi:catechol 2,3-dioxygenase-like lactoylglutathione lyase family enzyme
MKKPKLGHIGISVRRLETSIEFYRQAFGAEAVFGPTKDIVAGKGRMGRLCADKMGPYFTGMRLAVLKIDDDHGIELFEFPQTQNQEPAEHGTFLLKTGHFLFSLHCSDLEAACVRVIAAGGEQRSQIHNLWDGKTWRVVYCADPDGNIIELLSHPFEEMWLQKSDPSR